MREKTREELIEQKINLENRLKSGSAWFFWIAGLSLVNSIVIKAGGGWGFIVGLGITQFIDGIAIAADMGAVGNIITFGLNLIVVGIFILFGILARKRNSGIFIAGMILYALDGALFFIVEDFLGIGFHVFVLFCFYSGLKANSELKTLEARMAVLAQVESEIPLEEQPQEQPPPENSLV